MVGDKNKNAFLALLQEYSLLVEAKRVVGV